MKKFKKFASLLLAVMMVLSMGFTALAQTENVGTGSGSITISNAAKGETYSIYKLFDASVTGSADGSIAYTGTIPTNPVDLSAYFTEDSAGNISATEAAKNGEAMSDDLKTALANWAESATPTASAVSNGSTLYFTGLDYGYYVMTTSHGRVEDEEGNVITKAAISVDSTNPEATIYDKNTTTHKITKSVDDSDVYIGQTVTYTLTSETANFLGEGKDAEIVTQYVIEDTLPNFLEDVVVTEITIDGSEYKVDGSVPQFVTVESHTNKAIIIPWATKQVDGTYVSNYRNGAPIVITYTAKVTKEATVDGEGNTNTVTLTPYTDKGEGPKPWNEKEESSITIKTYAAALKKVDEKDADLAGAKFAAKGLTVEGSKGNYTVTAYDPTSTVDGTEMETDDNGHLVIKGLPSDVTLTVTETEAPAGYNKLTSPVTLTPTIINETVSATSKTTYYDADGNVTEEVTESSITTVEYNQNLKAAALKVENRKGVELPSTGGIGTTIFYVLGGILVLAAGVILVTRRRMNMGE